MMHEWGFTYGFGIGPFAMDVSLLSLVGVLIAYLIARSLF